jgi:response regulator NasT
MRDIAIADDDASERLVLRGLLEEAGYRVVAECRDGREAVDACRSLAPDAMVMDLRMPLKDGIEAAAEIGSIRPTPIVLLTASDDEAAVKRAVVAGVMAYLTKPVRLEELLPAIELAISRFNDMAALRRENADLKKALESRKVVEKAKGLLMEMDGLTENDAYARLRRASMDGRKTMAEVAEVIIAAFEGRKA